VNAPETGKQALLDSLRGLIVSCQAHRDDPIYTDDLVTKMAQAARWGGAVGIRANTPEQIRRIKAAVDLPLIGLYKIWSPGTDVFITPTLDAAKQVWEAGAEIIALDCTDQLNADGEPAWTLLERVKRAIPEAVIFADVSNFDEAAHAVDLGAEIVGPTLRGYTEQTRLIEDADYREFARMCRELGHRSCVVMEGHVYTPEDAMKALYLGAHAVVVGSAITRPHLTTKRFTDLIGRFQDDWRQAERSSHANV
jgi:N-acylglucosamine-6-phosphate 2-epimerase